MMVDCLTSSCSDAPYLYLNWISFLVTLADIYPICKILEYLSSFNSFKFRQIKCVCTRANGPESTSQSQFVKPHFAQYHQATWLTEMKPLHQLMDQIPHMLRTLRIRK